MKQSYLLLGLGIIGVGGYFLYKKMMNSQLQSPTSLAAVTTNPNLISQPSQSYPYVQPVGPRVDNSNQPWYGANRSFISDANAGVSFDQNFLNNVAYVKGTAEIGKSVASLWSDLSDMFGSSDEPTIDFDTEQSSSFNWDSLFS